MVNNTKKQTEVPMDCFWRKAGSCNIPLNKFEKIAFIIASNDPSRIEIVNKIKNLLKEFNLEGIMAVELDENNNLSAFCDNICAYIRGARINIVDVTAPLKECSNCNSEYEEPSVNVYWEYGYAAGLKRPIILICEQNQKDSIPFNILDKQILYYCEETLVEELGRTLLSKLKKSIEPISEEYAEKVDLLDIGKITDSIKTMGKGEMINIIRQTKFEDLFNLTENIMETITHFETKEESKDQEGLYSFVFLLLKSTFTDEEYVKIFEIIFNKILEISDYRTKPIVERIEEFLYKTPIKDWIIKNNILEKIIDIFANSRNFKEASKNASIILNFSDGLNQNQIIKIFQCALENYQIKHPVEARRYLNALINRHRNKIPIDLWSKLINENLDENAISAINKFKEHKIKITYSALKIILSLQKPWKQIDSIFIEKILSKVFNDVITLEVLKKSNDKEIQEVLLSIGPDDYNEKIIS